MAKDLLFREWPVRLSWGKYVGGRTALALMHAEDGDPVACCTVNIPEASLGENEILVKNWTENEGMDDWLAENGIAKHTGRDVATGYVSAPVMELLIKPEA